MKKYTVLFQGDSITDCGRMTCGGAGYDNGGLGPGYPGMVASRLLYDRPEVEWKFINLGISGHRIVDLYARWKRDAINLAPDVISILVGVNDTWHHFASNNGVEVPRYARIYREILTWTREALPNVKFVLMDPFLCPDLGDYDDYIPELIERRKVVYQLAQEFDAIHIPLQGLFNAAFKRAPQSYWTVEGVHPTPAGHQLITDAWLEATKELFN